MQMHTYMHLCFLKKGIQLLMKGCTTSTVSPSPCRPVCATIPSTACWACVTMTSTACWAYTRTTK